MPKWALCKKYFPNIWIGLFALIRLRLTESFESLVKIMFQHLVYSYILLLLLFTYNKWVKRDMKLCSLYLLGELGIRRSAVILKDKSRRAVPPLLCCELVLFFVYLILEMN